MRYVLLYGRNGEELILVLGRKKTVSKDIKVIGNIYENPELLKEKEK